MRTKYRQPSSQYVFGYQKFILMPEDYKATKSGNPIVLIVTLVAGLVVALITLWNTNDGFREAVTNAWEKIKEVFGTVIDAIKGFFSGLVEKVQTA